jgi:hypothetical protein
VWHKRDQGPSINERAVVRGSGFDADFRLLVPLLATLILGLLRLGNLGGGILGID